MIHDLDSSLEQLLQKEMPRQVNISFEQPTGAESKKFSQKTPTLNLFLFDVRENNMLRQHQWQAVENGNGRSQKQRTPYRFDCHYLLTAWASSIEDQHRVLSEAMYVLLQYPLLPDDVLVGSLERPQFPIQTRLGSHDKLTNPAELWSALENQIRAAVSYIVTIELNPWQVELEEPPVHTKRLRLQQRHLPHTAAETVQIAGTVRSEKPMPGEMVVVLHNEQWHYEATVAENGRYTINHVLPGSYTLTAWEQTGPQARHKLVQHTVIVPLPVHVLSLADTFRLQIGAETMLEGLHLNSRRRGYIGKALPQPYLVEDVGTYLPRSGIFHFGREQREVGEGEVVAAVVPSTVPDQISFRLLYQEADEKVGNYDLTI